METNSAGGAAPAPLHHHIHSNAEVASNCWPSKSSRISITLTTDPAYPAVHATDRCTSKGMVWVPATGRFDSPHKTTPRAPSCFSKSIPAFCPVAHDPHPLHPHTPRQASSRAAGAGAQEQQAGTSTFSIVLWYQALKRCVSCETFDGAKTEIGFVLCTVQDPSLTHPPLLPPNRQPKHQGSSSSSSTSSSFVITSCFS